jgi:hypothetical protein
MIGRLTPPDSWSYGISIGTAPQSHDLPQIPPQAYAPGSHPSSSSKYRFRPKPPP